MAGAEIEIGLDASVQVSRGVKRLRRSCRRRLVSALLHACGQGDMRIAFRSVSQRARARGSLPVGPSVCMYRATGTESIPASCNITVPFHKLAHAPRAAPVEARAPSC